MKYYGRSNEVVEHIVDAFRHPEQLPIALAPIFIRRNDDVPCRAWSFTNQLVIALCGTVDARGIRQWNAVGRTLKPGSKAIYILAPCTKTMIEKDSDGNEKERRLLYGFRSIPVFAVEDTEGKSLPELDSKHTQWIFTLPLIDVATDWGIHVGVYTHRDAAPLGYYKYGSNGEAIMLGVENLSTWAHELVHAADQRVTELKGDKWCKEIVAELGGAVLLTCMGRTHDADLGGAYQYIESYATEAKMDTARACIEVINRVCACVDLILNSAETIETAAIPA